MKTETLAYIAGIIEADGWIGWHKTYRTVKGKKYGPYKSAAVEVSMTDPEASQLLTDCFGGESRLRDNYKRKRKSTYTAKLTGYRAVNALIELLPYLRLERKRESALEILTYYGAPNG